MMKAPLFDTIAAIATPPGYGGVGIIRVSGPQAIEWSEIVWLGQKKLKNLESYRLTHGKILEDDGLVVVMRAPHSFTGEDVVEFQVHGSPTFLQTILQALFRNKIRPAEPGEFSKRAFLNGRMDLSQAEAVSDLIHSETTQAALIATRQLSGSLSKLIGTIRQEILSLRAGLEAQLDFSEEEDVSVVDTQEIQKKIDLLKEQIKNLLATYEEGRRFREGVRVVICGRPNAGKSSLLNALVMDDKAIVHDAPGTTRDVIEETIHIGGMALRLADTAGIRNPPAPPFDKGGMGGFDSIEEEGIRRSWKKLNEADLILFLVDASVPYSKIDEELYQAVLAKKPLIIFNKSDLALGSPPPPLKADLKVSAKNHESLEALRTLLKERLLSSKTAMSGEMILTNSRHKDCLEKGLDDLTKASTALQTKLSLEFPALDLMNASNHLAAITGEITSDAILGEIFSKFCVGK